jgi:HEAT repeat protein
VGVLAAALLVEGEPRVREAMLTSLAKSGTPEAVAAVLPHLRSDDAGLRTGALDALRAMPSAVAPRLADLLQDPDPDVRILACELVRYAPAEQASKLLATVLEHDPEINVCAAAVEILAEIGGADDVVPLSACARRFSHASFLRFSIEVTLARISAGAPQQGG